MRDITCNSPGIVVYLVGPGPQVCGGITTLIDNLRENCPSEIEYRLIATHSSYRSSYAGAGRWSGAAAQAAVYMVAVFKVLIAASRRKNRIFHIHLSQEGSAVRKGLICILLRFLGVPYIVHTHAAEDKLFHPWVPHFMRRALGWGIRGCRYLIVLNAFWAEYYALRLSMNRERIAIFPNPADLPAEVPNRNRRDRFTVLFLGRLGERKGVFDLIRALAAIPITVRNNMTLVLSGDGAIEEAKKLATESGCLEQTRITGWIGRAEVRGLLAEADVLALPSYAEGMAIAVLEGLSWGLPVITTASCGSTSFLQDRSNCLLVQPGNITEIRDALLELHNSRELRTRLGREARRTGESLSIEKYMERLKSLYFEIAGTALPETAKLPSQQVSA